MPFTLSCRMLCHAALVVQPVFYRAFATSCITFTGPQIYFFTYVMYDGGRPICPVSALSYSYVVESSIGIIDLNPTFVERSGEIMDPFLILVDTFFLSLSLSLSLSKKKKSVHLLTIIISALWCLHIPLSQCCSTY